MTETINFITEGPIARINLNNPNKRNAIGSKELLAIHRALNEIDSSSHLRVLILSSTAGSVFCAGASLDDLRSGAITSNDFQNMTNALAEISVPTICAINGNIFGGGVELALSCDFRFGCHGIKMRVPASALGLCYPVQGIKRFVGRLGHSTAKRILLSAETLSDTQLLEMGFIQQILSDRRLEIAVNAYAENLCRLAPLSLAAMKQIINRACEGAFNVEKAEKLATECLDSDDLREGLLAQQEKRAPKFIGS